MNKICKKCNQLKNIDDFYICKIKKDGYRNVCKKCCSDNSDSYYKQNKEKIIERVKNYTISNKNKVDDYQKKYYDKNQDKIKNKSKEYRLNNKDYLKEYKKTYNYRKKRPYIYAWRNVLHLTLQRFERKKSSHTIDMLGYTADDLKNHISNLFTNGMCWDNYGEWHIDHIIPLIAFNRETPVNIVCALNNLQPLWATTRKIDGIIYEGNLNKSGKY
jgi:hypothetical protein